MLQSSSSCHAERIRVPQARDEGEPKDPDGASSAMPSQGVFSILLRVNALMLRLGRTYYRDPSTTRPSARVRNRFRWRCARDDRRKRLAFQPHYPSTFAFENGLDTFSDDTEEPCAS